MPACPKCGQRSDRLGAKCQNDAYHFVDEEGIKDAQDDSMVGRMIAGKYVILGLINEGGMGAVYRALQMPIEREIAFKVLRADLNQSDEGKERFKREARAISRLVHPNIITLHDFGLDDSAYPYMVMEYAPGKSLARWLKSETVTTERVVHVVEQVLSALIEAHEAGIVHRDLKPENIIITRSGQDHDFVKLLDFGIARMVNEGSTRGLTREGEVFGTPHYMAPEQAQGASDIGPAADLYAVGIMLFEMLTGECPFDAPTPLSVLYMHINEPLPALEARPGVEVDARLERVLEISTAKDPQARYTGASEMLDDLHSATPVRQKVPVRSRVAGQGVGLEETSLEEIIGAPEIDTMAPGSRPLDSTTHPPRSKYDTGPGLRPVTGPVDVYDPEPSIERPIPGHLKSAPNPAYSSKQTQPSSDDRTRTFLIGAIAALALFLVGGIAYGVLTSPTNQSGHEASQGVASEDGAEVSGQEPTSPGVAEVERPEAIEIEKATGASVRSPGDAPEDTDEAAEAKPAEPDVPVKDDAVAEKQKPADAPKADGAKQDSEAPVPESRTTKPKQESGASASVETAPKEPAEKPSSPEPARFEALDDAEPKDDSESSGPKKFEPKKFQPKDPRKW